MKNVFERFANVPGDIGYYYKNLVTGEVLCSREEELFLAASVIKLPVFAAVLKLYSVGELDFKEKLLCREEDKLPSCGALNLINGEVELDILSLCHLMICISDNSATNLIINRLGIEKLNSVFREIGFEKTHIERLLFDIEGSKNGKQNRICLRELGEFLEKIYNHTFIDGNISKEIEGTLLKQEINHKIPGYFNREIPVAHKTGEDDGITNDVGIIYADEPFILCIAANNVDVAQAEIAIREVGRELTQ